MPPSTYKAIGIMSGSSLDGLDLAYCRFEMDGENVDWQLLAAECVPFDPKWVVRLKNLPLQDALIFAKTHTYFGHYMGEQVNAFVDKFNADPDFVATHGHTIFHEPEARMTCQIGDGAALAATSGYPVITGFRYHDVALYGEGAPLAPIADKYLYPGYDFYLNLGGIANISANVNGRFIAFDICGANALLNFLAQHFEKEYDEDGLIAESGEVDMQLLETLSGDAFFEKQYPKSLSNQWVQGVMVSHLRQAQIPEEDKLRTTCEHVAEQICEAIHTIIDREELPMKTFTVLATGGGALNSFLMRTIQEVCEHNGLSVKFESSDGNTTKFKEAILMAFMGVLRLENRPNCLSSVTGAKADSIGGAIYQGVKKII